MSFFSRPARLKPALFCAFLIGLAFGGFFLRNTLGKSLNDGYVDGADMTTYIVGANYFQQQDWQFPIFDFEGFRYPEGGSLIYTDGIPIVGFFAKLIYPLTGSLLDYFSWYLLFCYGMQGLAVVLLLRESGIRHWASVVTGSLLAAMTPALLFRYGHIALSSHYLILLAFWIYLKGRHGRKPISIFYQFFALLIGALFIHSYLFIMVGAIFAAYCLTAVCEASISRMRMASHCLIVAASLLLLMIIAGHIRLDVEMGEAEGFGFYSSNFLSLIWPQKSGISPWPTPLLDANGGQYEGYGWLGFGVLILFAISAFQTRKVIISQIIRHWQLAVWLLSSFSSHSVTEYTSANIKYLRFH